MHSGQMGFGNWGFGWDWGMPYFLPLALLLAAWVLFWKGMALWKAARNSEKGWFVALLVINTLGILEILYLYVFSKKENKQPLQQ